jgi:hypothetical protein
MLASIPWFLKIPIACKQKSNAIYKQYKDDKVVNGILGYDHHECPFYDALDSWWRWSRDMMKHVSVSANETQEIHYEKKWVL